MSQSISMILVGGLIRVLQGFAQAAPTLLVGLLIATILRFYLGKHGTKRLFGGDHLRSLPQSWLIGMLLPVCSIGVLPILFEMRRAKVKPGAMTAFALSAPLFNPLSLLYGLTLSRPVVIILFALGSLLIVTILGLIWDRLAESHSAAVASDNGNTHGAVDSGTDETLLKGQPEDHLIGSKRIYATIVHVARESTGKTMLTAILALTGLALLAAVLPFGSMQHEVERDDWWAPAKMLLVALPVYATPMMAMSQLGMMFQHANSPGASFTLLILGTGMNVATPLWFARHYGWKSSLMWLGSLLVIVLGISYAINQPLVPPGVEPAGHTHAFDIYANPLTAYHSHDLKTISELVLSETDIGMIASLIALAIVAAAGIVFRCLRIDEASLTKNAKSGSFASSLTDEHAAQRRGLDWVVPPNIIGAAMLLGLVALSVVACFAYYPSPDECLDEIHAARAECLSAANSGNVEHALYWLPIMEDWSRRMEVGTFLRSGEVRPYQRMQGYLIRKKLENLEHELEHDPFEPKETKRVVSDILASYSRWANAFRPSK